MAKLYPKILFFIGGTTPSEDDINTANEYGPGVMFRNASLISPDNPIEDCDGVAGVVPDNYAEALPDVSDREAVTDRMMKRNPNLQTMGSDKPPRRESDAQRRERINNSLSRGARPEPVNERNAAPMFPADRTTQSGDARVTYAPPVVSEDGWGTDTDERTGEQVGETLNDKAGKGQPVDAGAAGWGGKPGQGDDTSRIAAGALSEQPRTPQAPPAPPQAPAARAPQAPPQGKHKPQRHR